MCHSNALSRIWQEVSRISKKNTVDYRIYYDPLHRELFFETVLPDDPAIIWRVQNGPIIKHIRVIHSCMVEGSDLSEAERNIRRANLMKSKAKSGGQDLAENDIDDLYALVEEEHHSWEVERRALEALNSIAKTRPTLLTGIFPRLIQNHLVLPVAHEDRFAYESVSTDPEIGRPIHASWILHNVAEQDPVLLSPHTDILTDIYQNNTTKSHYFLLTLGRLVIADPDSLPVDAIRANIQELADGDDWYAAEAEELLSQLG